MKRRYIRAAGMILLTVMMLHAAAGAEMSTNLRVETVTGVRNKPVTETYVDEQGNPVIASDKGYATIRYTYGTEYMVTRIELLDTEGNLINGVEGYARIENRYSGKKLQEQCYYDAEGNPVNGPKGYARQVTEGLYGNVQTVWEYDAEGNPVNTHRVTEYTKKGYYRLMTSDSWYDAENHLTPGPDGYARVENDYVSISKSRVAYMDENGMPFYYAKAGYATMIQEFNGTAVTSLSYYGEDGGRIPGPDGYSYALFSYRAGGYKKSMYYNADGSPWYNKKGVCGTETLQNIRKKTVEEYYFTGEGQRGRSTDGYSGVNRTYNKYGYLTQEKYLDENDKPMTVETLGYAKVLNTIKDKKLKTQEEYFDEQNQPAYCAKGYSKAQYAYERGKMTEVRYLDKDGKTPLNTTDGYARVTYERDTGGNVIRTNWYDAEGNPCPGESGAEEVRNSWEGKNKISESYWTAAGAPSSGLDRVFEIRMEYNGNGKVTRKSLMDPTGRLTAGKDGYAAVETEYNSEGGTMSVRYYNAAGELTLTPGKEYAYEKTVLMKDLGAIGRDEDEEEPAEETAEETAEEDEEDGEAEQNETAAENTEDEAEADTTAAIKGTIVEYYGTDEQLTTLKAGYAYIVRLNNSAGKVIEESYYSAEGESVTVAAGYARIEREYDNYGTLSREAYFADNGEKVTLKDGYHSYIRVNDNKGNALKTAYYDAEGQPAVNASLKCHRVDKTYLDAKHILTEAWFDTEGKATATTDTYCRIERTFDRNGNATDERTFDAHGNPICRNDGYDEIVRTYNSRNQAIQIQYLTGGKLCENVNGVAVTQREYDDAGNITAEWYLDRNGVATIHLKNKYSKILRQWKDAKHVTEEAWFDPWGKPMTTGDTFTKIWREFDENGNTIKEKTFGADGKQIARKAGYDEVRTTYNEQNRAVRIEYYLMRKPVAKNDGVAAMERTYDENGNIATESYFGTAGEPVLLNGNKYHRIDRTWLDAKHALSESWFDTKGMPATQGDTFVRIERTFDKKGNTLTEITCDETGKPIRRNAGYDETRWTWDENNRATQIEYLLGGTPVVRSDTGYAVLKRTYDENGNIATESYFGAEGEAVLLNGKKYHRIDRTWLDAKHATEEAWFDTEGQPMTRGDTYVRIEREFDERGNCSEERYFDPDGKAIACKGGYDTLRRLFDENNRPSRIFYLLNGEAFTVKDGYAVMEREYDEAGNVSAERYYDAARQAVSCKKGYGEVRKEYNGKKQVIREAWFDTNGTPITLKDTYCAVEREYDEAGNVSVTRYLDGEGNYIACKAGYEMVWKRYNKKKQVIFESYMDHNGEPMPNSKGTYQTSYDYNEAGKIIQEQYFNAEGELSPNSDGYVRLIRTWNEDGSKAGEEGRTE